MVMFWVFRSISSENRDQGLIIIIIGTVFDVVTKIAAKALLHEISYVEDHLAGDGEMRKIGFTKKQIRTWR